ncbi:hypothetical protein MB9_0348 [Methanobacterium formicicum]|uniref:HNH nuclease domain-containing protein n=2 Tax=Methanobacterium formicicum TaxID=2162 RepID=A0A0S4FLZ4_METFO|nr:hypothetical protein MB9_0348 [Methanobacterium formicicum]
MLEEFKRFEDALKGERIADAGELIKHTFNIEFYCRGCDECNHKCLEPVNCENNRYLVIEEFQHIANELNFKFHLTMRRQDVSRVKWYYEGEKIFPQNGPVRPIVFRRNMKTKRNPIPAALRHEVFVRDGYRCRECGATNRDEKLEVDHIISVAQGGTDELDNLQTLCQVCNRAKSLRVWKSPVN